MAAKSPVFSSRNLFLIFLSGLVIRLLLIPQPGFEADIAYWKWWGDVAAQKGAAQMIASTGINYPPFFAFVLEAIGRLYYLLGGTVESLFETNNLLFLFLAKILPIITDLATAFLIYIIVSSLSNLSNLGNLGNLDVLRLKTKDQRLIALICTALYLFNPVIIFDSSYWGQTDSIAAFLTLLFFYLFLKGRVFLAFIVAAIAFFTKVQTGIFIPILILLTLKTYGLKKIVEALFISTATAYLINLPYILARIMPRVLSLILDSPSYFPFASLNAYNIWWIITKGTGFTTSDHTLIGGFITYKTTGLLLFGLIYILACYYLWTKLTVSQAGDAKRIIYSGWQERRGSRRVPAASFFERGHRTGRAPDRTRLDYNDASQNFGRLSDNRLLFSLFLTCSIVSFAFFMLPTEIHERYIYPLFMFLTLLFPYFYKSKLYIIHCTFYILLTLSIFLNLHLVLVLNYPDNGLPIISLLNNPPIYLPLTFLLSIINFIMFISFIIVILKSLGHKTLIALPAIALATAGLISLPILGLNLLNSQKKEISLVSLKPTFATQEYKTLQKNRSVEQNNLSSAYYFYSEGLGSHANSQIVYNLGGKFKRFITDFGVDTEAAENASVEFIIKVDQKFLLKTPIMKKWTTPGHVDLDVAGAKTLELIITDAADGRSGDHADWLQPKLYKR